MSRNYNDIINLPHHVSDRRPHMPIKDRAAQFSPFAALTGYEGEVKEAARLTEAKIELSEDQKAILDEHLCLLENFLPHRPKALFTYFEPDLQKDGGVYVTVREAIKRLDRVENRIILANGTVIPVENLFAIDSELWSDHTNFLS